MLMMQAQKVLLVQGQMVALSKGPAVLRQWLVLNPRSGGGCCHAREGRGAVQRYHRVPGSCAPLDNTLSRSHLFVLIARRCVHA